MKNLLMIMLFAVLLVSSYAYADDRQFQQQDSSCSACEEDDTSCTSVNGKRIDSGDSLGARETPPANSEAQLQQDSRELSTEKQQAEPLLATQKTVRRAQRKQVIDSSTAPKFTYGKSELTPSLQQDLTKLAAQLKGKENLNLRIVGHTDSHQLSAKAAVLYGDNFGLGRSRAKQTAVFLADLLNLSPAAIKIETEGPFKPLSENFTAAGRAKNRRVEIFIVYDQTTTVEELITVPAPPVTVVQKPIRSCAEVLTSSTAAAAQAFRISIDGVLLNDPGTIDPDIQRCTDLALEKSDIQIRYDAQETTPWLNVSATPNSAQRNEKVIFSAYSNYDFWIKKRELRIFADKASTQAAPLQVIPIDQQGRVEWLPNASSPRNLQYVLRVYDAEGRFDETAAKALRIDHRAKPLQNRGNGPREELIGYGENSLQIHNIPVHGGAITVNGRDLTSDSQVTVMGQLIPLAANGRFAARQILPAGRHLVAVQVTDQGGTLHFSRNLYIPDRDWFYVGIADLVAGDNQTSGPAALVTGDTQHYDNDLYVDGRLAFYLKGKIKGE